MRNLISSIGILAIALTIGACSTTDAAKPERDLLLSDTNQFEALPQIG